MEANAFTPMQAKEPTLSNLRFVSLSHNKLTEIDFTVFYKTSTSTLSIMDNRIEKVENPSARGLPKLRILYLDNNKIQHLPNTTFFGIFIVNRIIFR